MEIISDVKKYWRFFVAAVALLFLSMTVNFMGVADTKFFYDRNAGTESMFGNQIVCGGNAYGGFLLKSVNRDFGERQLEVCSSEDVQAYESTFNLVGRLYGYPYSALSKFIEIPPPMFTIFAQVTNALLVATILAIFLIWSKSNFGNITAITALFLMATSPQLMMNSATMIAHYNIFCFIPLLYCLYYYKPSAYRKYRILFWIAFAAIFCLKALTSYEYITTYAAMVASVVGYHLWINKSSVKIYIRELALVVCFCFLGLATAIGVHVGTLAIQKGSVAEAVNGISAALTKRTVGDEGVNENVNPYRVLRLTAPEVFSTIGVYVDLERREEAREMKGSDISFKDRLVDSVVSGVNYLMLPVFSLPLALKEPLATYVQSFAFFIILLIIAWKLRTRWVKDGLLNRKVGGIYIGLVIAFVGYLSWQVLARNHSLIHPHLNGFTMYIPFALFGYIIIGLLVDSGLQEMKQTSK